ncbi:hypothetical protein HDU76_002693 [Blyttiomyces sp. JEL0837]|nr:hypothetical protein HDU76_002693 [Blyttiomyces sp. JEL0837]
MEEVNLPQGGGVGRNPTDQSIMTLPKNVLDTCKLINNDLPPNVTLAHLTLLPVVLSMICKPFQNNINKDPNHSLLLQILGSHAMTITAMDLDVLVMLTKSASGFMKMSKFGLHRKSLESDLYRVFFDVLMGSNSGVDLAGLPQFASQEYFDLVVFLMALYTGFVEFVFRRELASKPSKQLILALTPVAAKLATVTVSRDWSDEDFLRFCWIRSGFKTALMVAGESLFKGFQPPDGKSAVLQGVSLSLHVPNSSSTMTSTVPPKLPNEHADEKGEDHERTGPPTPGLFPQAPTTGPFHAPTFDGHNGSSSPSHSSPVAGPADRGNEFFDRFFDISGCASSLVEENHLFYEEVEGELEYHGQQAEFEEEDVEGEYEVDNGDEESEVYDVSNGDGELGYQHDENDDGYDKSEEGGEEYEPEYEHEDNEWGDEGMDYQVYGYEDEYEEFEERAESYEIGEGYDGMEEYEFTHSPTYMMGMYQGFHMPFITSTSLGPSDTAHNNYFGGAYNNGTDNNSHAGMNAGGQESNHGRGFSGDKDGGDEEGSDNTPAGNTWKYFSKPPGPDGSVYMGRRNDGGGDWYVQLS